MWDSLEFVHAKTARVAKEHEEAFTAFLTTGDVRFRSIFDVARLFEEHVAKNTVPKTVVEEEPGLELQEEEPVNWLDIAEAFVRKHPVYWHVRD